MAMEARSMAARLTGGSTSDLAIWQKRRLTKSRFFDSFDISSKPDRSQDQEQSRTNDENPNGPRDSFASRCKALGGNCCRY